MKKALLYFLTAFMLITTLAHADFSVDVSSIEDTLEFEEASSSQFSITNNGDDPIEVNLSTLNASNGGSTIDLSLNQTSKIINESASFLVEYTAGNTAGEYEGSIEIESSNSTESIPVILNVFDPSRADLEFVDQDGVLVMNAIAGEIDSRSFTLRNNGSVDLEEIRISIDDLRNNRRDRLRTRDLEFNGERASNFEIVELFTGESTSFRVRSDLPSSIDPDTYRGNFELSARDPDGNLIRKEFSLRIIVSSDEEDVSITSPSTIRLFGESGERLRNYDIRIRNDGNNDVRDMSLEVDREFRSETSSHTMSASIVDFSRDSFDVFNRRSRDISYDVYIPSDQAQGTYNSRINLLNAQGDRLDSIPIQIQVVGDVYISDVDYPSLIRPGDNIDVDVEVTNRGSSLYRNVRVGGTIFNVDRIGTDLQRSSSSFLLESDSVTTETIRFRIPEDATHGTKTFELDLSYDGETVSQIETLSITRPSYEISIPSHSIRPSLIRCQETISVSTEARNLGRFTEDVIFFASVDGIREESSSRSIDVDQRIQQGLTLDVSSLEPGNYTVTHGVVGQSTSTVQSSLTVEECAPGGVDIDPSLNVTDPDNGNDTVPFFGLQIDRTTAVLGSVLAGLVILIIASLFFL